jgi:hypothetical protein
MHELFMVDDPPKGAYVRYEKSASSDTGLDAQGSEKCSRELDVARLNYLFDLIEQHDTGSSKGCDCSCHKIVRESSSQMPCCACTSLDGM